MYRRRPCAAVAVGGPLRTRRDAPMTAPGALLAMLSTPHTQRCTDALCLEGQPGVAHSAHAEMNRRLHRGPRPVPGPAEMHLSSPRRHPVRDLVRPARAEMHRGCPCGASPSSRPLCTSRRPSDGPPANCAVRTREDVPAFNSVELALPTPPQGRSQPVGAQRSTDALAFTGHTEPSSHTNQDQTFYAIRVRMSCAFT